MHLCLNLPSVRRCGNKRPLRPSSAKARQPSNKYKLFKRSIQNNKNK